MVFNATATRAVGQVRRQGWPNGAASPSKLSLHIPPELVSHVLPRKLHHHGWTNVVVCNVDAQVWWVHATQCGRRGWTRMVRQYKFRELRVYFGNIKTGVRTSDKFGEMNVQFESTRT